MMTLTVAFAGAATGQQVDQERDPFFGDGPRSTSTSSSQGNGEWGRDPFARPFEGTAATLTARAPEKKLTGIIYGKNERIAIIGGEMVREGSMVGDQKLMSIHKRSIVLMNSTGNSEEIFLENFSIRK
jgi:hypothetical protein